MPRKRCSLAISLRYKYSLIPLHQPTTDLIAQASAASSLRSTHAISSLSSAKVTPKKPTLSPLLVPVSQHYTALVLDTGYANTQQLCTGWCFFPLSSTAFPCPSSISSTRNWVYRPSPTKTPFPYHGPLLYPATASLQEAERRLLWLKTSRSGSPRSRPSHSKRSHGRIRGARTVNHHLMMTKGAWMCRTLSQR